MKLGEGQGARKPRAEAREVESARSFAKRGIVGLKSENTVARYVRAWMDQVGEQPRPGQKVTLPNVEFPQAAKIEDTEPGRKYGSPEINDWLSKEHAEADNGAAYYALLESHRKNP